LQMIKEVKVEVEEDEYYTTITGSTIAGDFLHRLALEFMPGTRSGAHLTKIGGKTWRAIKITDLRKYYNIPRGNDMLVIQILKLKGLIDMAVYDVDGVPTTHIRPSDKFWDMLENHYESE